MSSARSKAGQTPQTRLAPEAGADGSTRQLLLQAASQLMIEAGTHDVSLHAIARKAGVTAPLIKYHFGSKDGLLLALAQRDTNRSQTQLEDLVASDLDPLTKLRIHITGIVRTYARYPYLNGLLDNLQADDASGAAASIRDGFVVPLIEAQRKIILEGVSAGVLRPVDPDMAYFLIVGTCHYVFSVRVAASHLIEGDRNDDSFARRYAAQVTDIIFNGLVVR